jgi:hypothetical protein
MATRVPQPLQDVLSSLTLSGVPATANPGDRIMLQISPSIAPVGTNLPDVLMELTRTDVLATLELDPTALVEWLVQSIGLDGWAKAVEFDQATNAAPAALTAPSAVERALPHLVAGVMPPQLSLIVEGLVGRLELAKKSAAGPVGKILGTLSKPGILGQLSQPAVEVRVFDETGKQLGNGEGFFQSGDFVPSLVFFPVAVANASIEPVITRTLSVHVSMTYTPPGTPPPDPIPLSRTFGPFSISLATVEVPVVALLARHALTNADADPGHVFVGVPGNSPLNTLGEVITALSPLRTVLANLDVVLRSFGIALPPPVAAALWVLEFVPTVAADFRFGKGDLLSLWALFADWQRIMSAAMVLGPSSRRAFFGAVLSENTAAGFSLYPARLGVGFIPDLNTTPITSAATVGTAVDDWPLPNGTYDNRLTSINFPAS